MMINKFFAIYCKDNNFENQDAAIVVKLVKDGLITELSARNYMIRHELAHRYYLDSVQKERRKLAKKYGLSIRWIREITEGVE